MRSYRTFDDCASTVLLGLSSSAIRRRRALAEERRIRARFNCALELYVAEAHRRRSLEASLGHEDRPGVRTRLLEELDAREPLFDAAQRLLEELAGTHAAARACCRALE